MTPTIETYSDLPDSIILQNVHSAQVEAVAKYLPDISQDKIHQYLTNIDLGNMDETTMIIMSDFILALGGQFLASETSTNIKGLTKAFKELADKSVEAGFNELISDEGRPPSDEEIKSHIADLRAIILLIINICAIHKAHIRQVLEHQSRLVIATLFVKEHLRIPNALFNELSKNDIEQIRKKRQFRNSMRKNNNPYKTISELIEANNIPLTVMMNTRNTIDIIAEILIESSKKEEELKQKNYEEAKKKARIRLVRFFNHNRNPKTLIEWLLDFPQMPIA